MVIERVVLNDRNEALIICPQCGSSDFLILGKKRSRRIVARCGCGAMFHVVFIGLNDRKLIVHSMQRRS
jgi:uncharacterized Zn finger protein